MAAIRDCAIRVKENYGFNFDLVADFDITSPIRTLDDINNGLKAFNRGNYACIHHFEYSKRFLQRRNKTAV